MKRGIALGTIAVTAGLVAACGSDKVTPAEPGSLPRSELLKPDTCGKCHTDHYKEWSTSAHSFASRDPLFLAMNKRGQEETHGQLGNFCVNCHAPMAVSELADGGNQTIDPETIPEELQGVTCYFCHDVESVNGTHNNPLVLSHGTTMRGAISRYAKDEPAIQYGAHIADSSPLHDSTNLKSANLCGACHDIVVPAHFSGADAGTSDGVKLERTFAEWSASNIGPNGQQSLSCGGCHMDTDPRGNVPIASPPGGAGDMPSRRRHLHTFAAVDTPFWEADETVRNAQVDEIQRGLDKELRIQICLDLQNGTNDVLVDLENNAAGHNFPSGASQDRRLWAELEVSNETKTYKLETVGSTESIVDRDVPLTDTADFPLFRDRTTKRDGSPAHMFWDVATIEDHTIPVAPAGNGNGNRRPFRIPGSVHKIADPKSIKIRVWLEPVGRDVVADLMASGHITADSAVGQMFTAGTLPRYSLVLGRASATVPDPWSFEWTMEGALANNTVGGNPCMDSTPKTTPQKKPDGG